MYAEYGYYKENFFGKIPENEYDDFAVRASRQMDYFTFDRIKKESVTDKIKLCQCELAEYLYILESQAKSQQVIDGKGAVKSETVDDYKVEYGSVSMPQQYGSSGGMAGTQRTMLGICQKYLTRPINYMYAGVER